MTSFRSAYSLMALTALGVGILVYLLDRSPEHVYFLSPAASWMPSHEAWLGPLGGWLPDFVHVYAFALLTAAVVPQPKAVLPICAFWLVVDVLFELGQYPPFAGQIAGAIPTWFQEVPILDNTAAYFLQGVFDPWDLLAIFLGTLAAYLTLTLIAQRDAHHASQP